MKVFVQLHDFIQSKPSQKNLWLEDDEIKVYVRKGFHCLNSTAVVRTLDIATVQVSPSNQRLGVFSRFLREAHYINPYQATYVECVYDEWLRSHLTKNGYLPAKTDLCFYKLK